MHTSKMILDASSWIIKFPKVPFAHHILKAANAARMNHCGFVRIYRRRAEKEGERLFCFIRLPRLNCISFEQFDSKAGHCGTPLMGDRKASEQIAGFALLRVNRSCRLLWVWGFVISSSDLLMAFKVELLSQAPCALMNCVRHIAFDSCLTV